MLHAQRFTTVHSQCLCRADGVLDLSTVEVVTRQGVVVLIGETRDRDLLQGPHALDEDLENGLLCLDVEVVVPQRDVDPGLESVVECLSPKSVLCIFQVPRVLTSTRLVVRNRIPW